MVSIDHMPFSMPQNVDWSVMVQQDFPLSGVLGAKKKAAEAAANVAKADVSTIALDVERDAVLAFLMRAEIERMSVVVDQQLALDAQIVAATEARLAGGEGNVADAVRAQSDVARLKGQRKALDGELVGATAMLNAALNRPLEGSIPEDDLALPVVDPSPTPTLVALALEHRPELASMKASTEVASANVEVMESMYTPMAFVRLGTARTMEAGQGGMLMVGVSVPIWREKLDAGVSEAKQMTVMADADLSAMKTMISGEVGSARAQVIAARTRLESVQQDVLPLAKKAYDLTLASYAGGQMPLVSVLDAARALREARMEEVAAEVATADAWVRLGRAVGVVKGGAL